jgi:hypothetical protein
MRCQQSDKPKSLQLPFLAYCVEKLAFSRKLVNSSNLKPAKLLFLLGCATAETLEIR